MSNTNKIPTSWIAGSSSVLFVPKVLWTWSVFGGDMMVVKCPFEIPLWRRTLCRVFLGSTFTREVTKGAGK